MKLGCCVNMLGSEGDPTGSNWIPTLAENGYDYVELPLAQVMDLDEETFQALRKVLERSEIPCECCNNFFPVSLRLTGPEVDRDRILAYAGRALDRACGLGAGVVVFGSSGAKNIPDGFDFQEAWRQVVWALEKIGGQAREKGITIAIEPLNRAESNLICSVGEGYALMRAVDHPNVRLLVDYYHFAMEQEGEEALLSCADAIVHTHFACLEGRAFPTRFLPEHRAFYEILRQAGYDGRISVEAYSQAPGEDLARFVPLFSKALGRELQTAPCSGRV